MTAKLKKSSHCKLKLIFVVSRLSGVKAGRVSFWHEGGERDDLDKWEVWKQR